MKLCCGGLISSCAILQLFRGPVNQTGAWGLNGAGRTPAYRKWRQSHGVDYKRSYPALQIAVDGAGKGSLYVRRARHTRNVIENESKANASPYNKYTLLIAGGFRWSWRRFEPLLICVNTTSNKDDDGFLANVCNASRLHIHSAPPSQQIRAIYVSQTPSKVKCPARFHVQSLTPAYVENTAVSDEHRHRSKLRTSPSTFIASSASLINIRGVGVC